MSDRSRRRVDSCAWESRLALLIFILCLFLVSLSSAFVVSLRHLISVLRICAYSPLYCFFPTLMIVLFPIIFFFPISGLTRLIFHMIYFPSVRLPLSRLSFESLGAVLLSPSPCFVAQRDRIKTGKNTHWDSLSSKTATFHEYRSSDRWCDDIDVD